MGGCYNFCCGKCSNILFSGLNPTHTIQMILYSLIGSGSLCYFLRNKITFKFFYHPHTFVFIKPKQSWNVLFMLYVSVKYFSKIIPWFARFFISLFTITVGTMLIKTHSCLYIKQNEITFLLLLKWNNKKTHRLGCTCWIRWEIVLGRRHPWETGSSMSS